MLFDVGVYFEMKSAENMDLCRVYVTKSLSRSVLDNIR